MPVGPREWTKAPLSSSASHIKILKILGDGVGHSDQSTQAPADRVDHEEVRTTPPPLRRRVEGRAALLAAEVRDLAERSADLLSRIDELCSPSMTKAG